MKRRVFIGLGLLGILVGLHAQYAIDWHTIDGGGGTSTGGVYTVTGSIGQPDAGRMTGWPYALEGGFWGIVGAVQMEGAPLLTVRRTDTNTVLISWPTPATGYALEQNPVVSGGTWNWVTNTPVQVGAAWQVILPAPDSNRFYRLKK